MAGTEPPPPPGQPPQPPSGGPPPGAPPPPGGPPPGWTPTPPGTPGYQSAPQTEGTAIAALCCAIAAFIACPVIPAIVALVLAHNSQQKINASGGRLTGDGLNTAARIISWIHLGLVALGIAILIIVGVTVGFDSDDNDFDDNDFGLALQYVMVRLGL
jgi:hypothetical protein